MTININKLEKLLLKDYGDSKSNQPTSNSKINTNSNIDTKKLNNLIQEDFKNQAINIQDNSYKQPQQHAHNYKIAQHTGLPTEIVEEDFDIVNQQYEADKFNNNLAQVQNPNLKTFATEKDNIPFVKNDLSLLDKATIQFLRYIQNPSTIFTDLKEGFSEGRESHKLGELDFAKRQNYKSLNPFHQDTKIDETRYEELASDSEHNENFLASAGRLGGQFFESFKNAGIVGGGMVAIGTGLRLTPVGKIPPVQALGIALQKNGFQAGLFIDSYQQNAGNSFAEMKNKGVDLDIAHGTSTAVGLLTGALESFSLGKFTKDTITPVKEAIKDKIKKEVSVETSKSLLKTFGKTYASNILTETATEVLQEGIQILGTEFAKELSGLEGDVINPENAQRLADTFWEVLKATVVLGSIPASTQTFGAKRFNDKVARQNGQELESTINFIEELQKAELTNLAPQKLEEYVNGVLLNNNNKEHDVHIEAEQIATYYQDKQGNIDYERILQNLGITKNEINEAITDNQDIKIPISKLTTSKDYETFKENIRVNHGLTQKEISEVKQDNTKTQDILKEELVTINAKEGALQVSKEIETQLKNAYKYRGNIAKKQAMLATAFFETMGERTNKNPYELYKELNLKIRPSWTQYETGTYTMYEIPTLIKELKIGKNDAKTLAFQSDLEIMGVDIKTATPKEIQQSFRQINNARTDKTFFQKTVNTTKTLFQSNKNEKRGSFTIKQNKDFTSERIITLFQEANLSTFFHEMGHFFLEAMNSIQTSSKDPTIQQDFADILSFLGVKNFNEIETEHHEKFARAFEAYLFEGKSPSTKLMVVFQTFARWMKMIYSKITNLDVELNNNIRRVFNKMLATDKQLQQAKNIAPIIPTLTEEMFESQEQYLKYIDDIKQTNLNVDETVFNNQMKNLKKENDKEYKAKYQKAKEQAESLIMNDPVNRAIYLLTRGYSYEDYLAGNTKDSIPIKIRKSDIDQYLKKDQLSLLPKFKFKKNQRIYTNNEDGIPLSRILKQFEITDEKQFLNAIIIRKSIDNQIEAQTDIIMQENNNINENIANEETIIDIVQNAKSQVLEKEIENLSSKDDNIETTFKYWKVKAINTIANIPLNKISTNSYINAQVRYATASQKAINKGDKLQAMAKKTLQLYYHYLYIEATKAQQKAEKDAKYLQKYSKNDLSLKKRLGQSAIDKLQKGIFIDVNPKKYKQYTPQEITTIREIVEEIVATAKMKNDMKKATEKEKWEYQKERILSNISQGVNQLRNPVYNQGGKTIEKLKAYKSALDKPDTIIRLLDGQEQGELWKVGRKPFRNAEKVMNNLINNKVMPILNKIRQITGKDFIKSIDITQDTILQSIYDKISAKVPSTQQLTKDHLYSIMLQLGSPDNKKALLNYGFTIEELDHIKNNILTKEDWEAIQYLWDSMNVLWDDLAKAHLEDKGYELKKQPSLPIDTIHGKFVGGYAPLFYEKYTQTESVDTEFDLGFLFEESEENKINRYAKNKIGSRHTKERRGSGGNVPVLSISVVKQYFNSVSHYIAYKKPTKDFSKVLNDKDIKRSIMNYNPNWYYELKNYNERLAKIDTKPTETWDKIFSHLRRNATFFTMASKTTTILMQYFGLTNNFAVLRGKDKRNGSKYIRRGMVEVYKSPTKKFQEASQKSNVIKNRLSNYDRDVNIKLEHLFDETLTYTKLDKVWNFAQTFNLSTKALNKIRTYQFGLIGLMDMTVSLPLWYGAYNQAWNGDVDGIAPGNEKAAIDYADDIVTRGQGSGSTMDLSRIQDGSELMKILTMFYNYFNATYNLLAMSWRQSTGKLPSKDFLISATLLIILPSILDEFKNNFFGYEDDPIMDAERLISSIFTYPLGFIPVIRDLPFKYNHYGSSANPIENFESNITGTVKGIKRLVSTGEMTKNEWKSSMTTLALATGNPLITKQFLNTAGEIYDTFAYKDGDITPDTIKQLLIYDKKDK
jgi:hypothetical protein